LAFRRLCGQEGKTASLDAFLELTPTEKEQTIKDAKSKEYVEELTSDEKDYLASKKIELPKEHEKEHAEWDRNRVLLQDAHLTKIAKHFSASARTDAGFNVDLLRAQAVDSAKFTKRVLSFVGAASSLPDETVQGAFALLDFDQDGKLDWSDFICTYPRFKAIMINFNRGLVLRVTAMYMHYGRVTVPTCARGTGPGGMPVVPEEYWRWYNFYEATAFHFAKQLIEVRQIAASKENKDFDEKALMCEVILECGGPEPLYPTPLPNTIRYAQGDTYITQDVPGQALHGSGIPLPVLTPNPLFRKKLKKYLDRFPEGVANCRCLDELQRTFSGDVTRGEHVNKKFKDIIVSQFANGEDVFEHCFRDLKITLENIPSRQEFLTGDPNAGSCMA